MSEGLDAIRNYAEERKEVGYVMHLGSKGMQTLWDACQMDADRITALESENARLKAGEPWLNGCTEIAGLRKRIGELEGALEDIVAKDYTAISPEVRHIITKALTSEAVGSGDTAELEDCMSTEMLARVSDEGATKNVCGDCKAFKVRCSINDGHTACSGFIPKGGA